GCLKGRLPDLGAEPGPGQVSVGIHIPAAPWIILAGRPALGSVAGVGVAAVVALAPAHRVAGNRAVAVPAGPRVGLGEAEAVRVGSQVRLRRPQPVSRCPEEQVAAAQVVFGHMRLELRGDLDAELEAAVLPVLGVILDEEPAALWMELRVYLDGRAA